MLSLPLAPMEPVRGDQPVDAPGWTAEVKWDGVRNVALVEAGRVRLFSRRLRERTEGYPELQALSAQVAADRAVLDGELVVLRDGRPSFPAILEREQAAGPAARRRAAQAPAVFMVFDLLEVAGTPLLDRPLGERQERLRHLLRPGGPALAVEGFPGTGAALLRAVAAAGLEGIVCKRLDSPYQPGPAKSPHWVKVKRRLEMLCVVAGYTVTGGRVGALLLGAHDQQGQLRYLGRAGAGLTQVQLAQVAALLPPAPCPFAPPPVIGAEPFATAPDRVVWVAPQVTVAVTYSEWTGAGRLRHPVVVGFSALPPAAAVLP